MGTIDVRQMAHETRQRVRDDVFALGGIDPILMGFNLITERPSIDGDPPKLDVMARRSKWLNRDEREKQRFRRLWHRYQNAFLSAVDYLHRRFPVHSESYLPPANMLATLAVFFYHHRGQPNRAQAKEIRKWFWATGVAQRYTGRGYHSNIVADARLFEALARGGHRRFVFSDYLDPVLDIQGAEYASRSARTRAFFCLLATRTPRYLENGEPIPLDDAVVSHANRRHRHHIFLRAQMKNRFPARTYNGLCNICFLVSRDNLMIGMRLPRRYLGAYRDEGRAKLRRVMRSHLIPVGKDCGIWKAGIVAAFKEFRKERLQLICRAFEKEAGIKLFRRS
jgi:hypothetical protein